MYFRTLLLDVRYALRQLRTSPGFTLTAVLTLAFGIGATTAIFSIVEGVLLRPLPFPEPSRLVTQGDVLEGVGVGSGAPGTTAAGLRAYTRDMSSYSSLGAYQARSYELSGAGDPAQINGARLTASMFPVLGVSPLLGRAFTQQEDEGRQQLAVVSYQMWHSRFHDDAHMLGQKILLDRNPYEIIGVMPRGFEFPLVPGQLSRSELWVPMSITQLEINNAAGWEFQMVGRLKPGVTAAQAEQDAGRTAQEIMRGFPAFMGGLKIHPAVQPLGESTVAQARPLVRTLFLAVVVVLFIACANLAGLLLVRVIRRRHEISVRLALGASASVILRQTLVETLTLSLAGGLLGLALASAALQVGVSFLPETLPRISAIGLDWQVAAFAMFLAVVTGLLCGLVPALSAARTAVNDALKEGGRTGTAGSGHARLRSGLVVAEVSVALVLLVASGLLLRSFEKMRSVPLGFRTDHLLTAAYGLPSQQYSTQAAVDGFDGALLRKLEQLPGVESVGVTPQLPAAGDDGVSFFVAEGYVPPKGAGMIVSWNSHEVMGHYFRAVGIPLLRGRDFTEADDARAPLVAVVNRTLAQHYWPGQDPIGKRVRWGVPDSPTPWMTVVGEVGDIKQTAADADTQAQIYQPASQNVASYGSLARPEMLNANFGSIVLRTMLPPEQMADSLRATVRSIDPQLPLTQVESMEQVIAEGQASRRFNAMLISCFAGVAVLLALLGIYSVIAFSAALRTQEMAIRLALGAQRFDVMGLVLTSGAKLGLAGCAIGAVAAVFATRLLRSLLFQVDPLDPLVLILAAIAIFLLALAASVIPARRAASIEPMQALRAE
ncbi:MAG TPA: ABC transporter permease [Terracidiphilus sp.]|nr:ABC transporter permease [Terracidiphilus sp.]